MVFYINVLSLNSQFFQRYSENSDNNYWNKNCLKNKNGKTETFVFSKGITIYVYIINKI